MKQNIYNEINRIIRKDFVNYLVICIVALVSGIAPIIGVMIFDFNDPKNKPTTMIFPLIIPFILTLFVAFRYFMINKNKMIISYKNIWKILLILTIFLIFVALYFLFITFLIPAFSYSYKKAENTLKLTIMQKYYLVKNITIVISATFMVILAIINALVIYLNKNFKKVVGENNVAKQYN